MFTYSFVSRLRFYNWLVKVFGRKTGRRERKSKKLTYRIGFETLETRLAPATVSQAGTVLTITLDTVNEQVAFTSSGATYGVTTTNPNFTITGGPLANFASTGNVGTITAAGLTQIIVNDTLQTGSSNEVVIFNDSGVNAYRTDFVVNLANDNIFFNSVSFNGASTFSDFATTLVSGGTGYAVGDALTVAGGTFTTPAQITVNTVGGTGNITGFSVTNPGLYTVLPTNPVSVTGGTGSGATFNLNAAGLTATLARGDVFSSLTSVLAMTTPINSLSLTTTTGEIGLLGRVVVGGTTNLSAVNASQDILANNPINDFTGDVTVSNGSGNVTITDLNAIQLAASNFGSGVTSVTALAGAITQSGPITTTGTTLLPAYATFDAVGGQVNLNNATNDFAIAGTSSVGGSVTDTPLSPSSNFTVIDVNAVQLGNITVGTGVLNVTAGGSITQASTVNGVAADGIRTGPNFSPPSVTFTVMVAGSDILLAGAPNNFGGRVVTFFNNGNVQNQALRDTSPLATLSGTSTFARATVPNNGVLTIQFDNASIVVPSITITGGAGALNLTSGGDIRESGAITVAAGAANFTLLRSGVIDLTTFGNNVGTVRLNDASADATSAIAYTGSGTVQLGNSNLGLGTFTINANGNLTQAPGTSITQKRGGGALTFNSAGANVTLGNTGNRLEGNVVIAGPAVTNITLANSSTLAAWPTVTTSVTNLTLNFTNAPISLPTLDNTANTGNLPNLTLLDLTACGIYQQVGSKIVLPTTTTASFNALNYPLLLTNASNDFASTGVFGIVVRNTGPNPVQIVDINSIQFVNFGPGPTNSSIGNGIFTVTAGQGATDFITERNTGTTVITQANNAGRTQFSVGGGGINLSVGGGTDNSLRGIIEFNTTGSASLNNGVNATMGTSVIGDAANDSFNTTGSTFNQNPGSTLTVTGASNFGDNITFDNVGNRFGTMTAAGVAQVSFNGRTSTLRDSKTTGLVIGTSNLPQGGGARTLIVHAAGMISQTGPLDAGTSSIDTALFDAGVNPILLNNPGNDFGNLSLYSVGATSFVNSVAITNGGAGYTSAPTVAFSGGGGTGATGVATLAGGAVVGVTITNPGSGYTSAPTITFTGGGAPTTAATATVNLAAVSIADVNSLALNKVDLGSGNFIVSAGPGNTFDVTQTANTGYIYQSGPGAITVNNATNDIRDVLLNSRLNYIRGTLAVTAARNGNVTNQIDEKFTKLTVANNLTLVTGGVLTLPTGPLTIGGDFNATYRQFDILDDITANTLTFTGTTSTKAHAVTDVMMTNGGAGYGAVAPLVVFSGGGGTGAAGTAIVVGGVVVGVNITNGGTGYTSAPTVQFVGGSGTGATGVGSIGNVLASTSAGAAANAITINGDFNVGRATSGTPNTLVLAMNSNNGVVRLTQGTWSEQDTNLIIRNTGVKNSVFNIGQALSGLAPVFNMVTGTIKFTGSTGVGSINVFDLATFSVGGKLTGAATPHVVTVNNPGGDITFNSGSIFQVETGSGGANPNAKLVKTAGTTGNILLRAPRLVGTGLAPVTPTTIIDVGALGQVIGFFYLSVDPNNADTPVDFFIGSDIAKAAYDATTVDIQRAGTVVGSFTDYTADHDKFTVTIAGGSGLVVDKDLNRDYMIVVRNAAAATTLTLTTSNTPGDGFTSNIAGIAANGPGALTINAGTIDLTDRGVGSVVVTNGGAGFTTVPTVTFVGGGATVPATGVAIMNAAGTAVVAIVITNPGSGYTSAPNVVFTGGAPTTPATATATLRGPEVRVQNQLTSMTVHDATGASIIAGGGNTLTTTINGRLFNGVNIDLGTVLNTLNAKQVLGGNITAERFGTFTIAGIPAMLVTGDLTANLVNRNTANSSASAIILANVAGTLGGTWDLQGNVATVNAKLTNGWSLSRSPTAAGFFRNRGSIRNVTTLNLGVVTNSNVFATGTLSTLTVTSWIGNAASFDTIDVNLLGTMKTTGNAAIGDVGDLANLFITVHDRVATGATTIPVALTTLSVAGNIRRDAPAATMTLLVEDGNIGTITVGRTLGLTNSMTTTATYSAITSITVGAWASGSSLDAKSLGTLKAVGKSAAGLFGDFNGTVNLHGTAGTTANTLGTFSASHNVTGSTFTIDNGGLGTFTVIRTMSNVTVQVLGGAGGKIGTLTAAEWLDGGGPSPDRLIALGIGTLKMTGAALTAPDSGLIVGDMTGVSINVFRNTGTTVGIGTFSVAGSLTLVGNGIIRSDNGITTLTIGRDLTTNGNGLFSLISVNNAVPGSDVPGRILTFTVGRWLTGAANREVNLAVNSLGTVTIKGYTVTENDTTNYRFGDLLDTNWSVRGKGLTTAVGIGTLTVNGNIILGVNNTPTTRDINAIFGVTTITVNRSVSNSKLVFENPTQLTAAPVTTGKLGTLTAGEISGGSAIRASSIGTLKTIGSLGLFPYVIDANHPNLVGHFNASDLTVPGFTGTPTAPVAVGTVSFVGGMDQSINIALAGGGTGYTVGDLLTVQGGVFAAPVQINVTSVNGTGVITGFTVANNGSYSQFPGNGAAVTGGTGNGATFNVNGTFVTMNVPKNITTFTALQTIQSSQLGVSFGANAKLGTLKAGSIFGVDLVTTAISTLSVSGNTTIGLAGSIANSLFTVTGAAAGVGIGTATVTGTVSNTNFNVFGGNVTSVTVGAFTGSEFLVGFHPRAGNDLTAVQDRTKTPVANASLANGGAGYTVGDVLTLQGGTFTVPAHLVVTSVAGGVITGFTILDGGVYSTVPTNPASVTGGTGTGATFNVTGLSTLISVTAAALANGGANYAVGDVLTVQGGTFTTAAQITVTSIGAGGVITGFAVTNLGQYTALPTNPASVLGGAGNGAKFNLSTFTTWSTPNRTLSTFKVTTPFNVANPLSAAFIDSLVVAGNLGTITLTGIDPGTPAGSDTVTYGIGFHLGGSPGVVTVTRSQNPPNPGVTAPRIPGYRDGAFTYLGF